MLKRVAAAALLLVASANANDMLPSVGLGDPKTVEHEDPGRALMGAGVEVSNAITLRIYSLFSLSLSSGLGPLWLCNSIPIPLSATVFLFSHL